MKKIKKLVEHIKEELQDADKYYVCSLLSDSPKEKEIYIYLANQELEHVNKLHDLAELEIRNYKMAGNEPPEAMVAIWDYEHEEIIKDTNRLKDKIKNL